MNIGIPKEVQESETRVALVPSLVSLLKRDKHEVMIEAGAGASTHFADAFYRETGAAVVESAQALYQQSDIVFKVQPPLSNTWYNERENTGRTQEVLDIAEAGACFQRLW